MYRDRVMEKLTYRGVIYGAFLVLALFTTTGHANGNFRLPNGTIPLHYTLRLDTAIDQSIFNYTGKVQIKVMVLGMTTQLVLHSTRNKIEKIQLRNDAGIAKIKNFKLDIEKEFLVIETATNLHPRNGMYTLEIDFSNSVDRADLVGFYKSPYRTENGSVRYIGATQFAPISARSAFPCFDEVGYKTTFELHISCGSGYHVRSNTPARTVQLLPNGKKLYSFSKTPRMPTYLVAWVISDFIHEYKELKRSGTTIATWAKPSSAHLLSYSVDASLRYIRAMEQYFAEPYSLPKIDNIAIPGRDLWPSGMENWGLVTYREDAIYINPRTDGMNKKRAVVRLIAHEYAHQIFGNLLTPQWWTYLWLKEGFATFYSYYLGSISHPEHNLRKQFIIESLQPTFNQDASATVHQMTYYAERHKDIKSLYSPVVYAKAACVIRMMNHALGERIFQQGIRHYIQHNKNRGIVTEDDLFNSLELVAKKEDALPKHLTVHEVFRTWSHQAGYPVVSVRRKGNEYFFTQQRYVSDANHKPFNSSWWIPISFATANNTLYEKLPAFWMAPHASEVSYTIPTSAHDVVVFNPHATGLYRVEYDDTMLRGIINQLSSNHAAIEPTARARLIDDTLHLRYNRGNNFSTVLTLLDYLRHETDILPWTIANENIRYLQSMLRTNEKASQLLQSFVETIVTPLLSRYNVHDHSNASGSIDELHSIVTELACDTNESCKKASQSILQPTAQLNLLHLSDSDRPKEFHRLIVHSKVSPRILLQSIETELSNRQCTSDEQAFVAKILIDMSRYAMEPSEEKLLTSLALTHAPSTVLAIEQHLTANRRWIDRNVQPLTDALTRFLMKKT